MATASICRLCSSTNFEPRFEKNGFKIERCLQCTHVQVTNPPQSHELEAYYDKGFFDKYYEKLQKDPGRQDYEYKKFNYRLAEIEKRAPNKGTLLDIGCSFGFFLNAGQRRGWKAYGVELADIAANYAMAKFNLPIINKPVTEVDFEADFFDVVTLWNVTEHLLDPSEAVRTICKILKPNGLVVLTTGNIDSPLARLQKNHWRMFIPPLHLSFFSPSTMAFLLKSNGLEPIEQTSALPYESALQKLGLINLAKRLNISDKMLVYGKKLT
jgi:SAM-dependent methyltransferase